MSQDPGCIIYVKQSSAKPCLNVAMAPKPCAQLQRRQHAQRRKKARIVSFSCPWTHHHGPRTFFKNVGGLWTVLRAARVVPRFRA
eukprot:scaffold2968_cov321-Pinguiococcus_pyrenoidosus.AAC.10